MTDEERDQCLLVLKRAVRMANHYGVKIVDECEGNAAVAATTAAVMLSTFCASAGMSMHDAVGLFMSVHKQTEAMVKERT